MWSIKIFAKWKRHLTCKLSVCRVLMRLNLLSLAVQRSPDSFCEKDKGSRLKWGRWARNSNIKLLHETLARNSCTKLFGACTSQAIYWRWSSSTNLFWLLWNRSDKMISLKQEAVYPLKSSDWIVSRESIEFERTGRRLLVALLDTSRRHS